MELGYCNTIVTSWSEPNNVIFSPWNVNLAEDTCEKHPTMPFLTGAPPRNAIGREYPSSVFCGSPVWSAVSSSPLPARLVPAGLSRTAPSWPACWPPAAVWRLRCPAARPPAPPAASSSPPAAAPSCASTSPDREPVRAAETPSGLHRPPAEVSDDRNDSYALAHVVFRGHQVLHLGAQQLVGPVQLVLHVAEGVQLAGQS